MESGDNAWALADATMIQQLVVTALVLPALRACGDNMGELTMGWT